MHLQKEISKTNLKNNLFFVVISEVTEEKSRIQNRIRKSSVRIQGSGSVPKFQGHFNFEEWF